MFVWQDSLLEAYISRGKKIALPASLPREMTETRAGVFVSLKKFGQPRGRDRYNLPDNRLCR